MSIKSPWVDVGGAAGYVHKKKSTMDRLRCTGDGPAYFKVGGRVLYHLDDLDAYVRKHRRISTSDPGLAAA